MKSLLFLCSVSVLTVNAFVHPQISSSGEAPCMRASFHLSALPSFLPELPNFFEWPSVADSKTLEAVATGEEFESSTAGLIRQAKRLLASDLGLQDAALLDESFRCISPNLDQPLNKLEYLAAGRFFNLRAAFPDLDYRAHDFRIDEDDPATVRITARTTGTLKGDLRLRDRTLPPNGKTMKCPPEAISISLDVKTGKVLKICSGFALDRLVGNTAGTTGVMAAATIAGQKISDWEIYPPLVVLKRFLGRPVQQLRETKAFLAPFPENVMVQLAKGILASNMASDDPTLLAETFTYITPFIGPIQKKEFLEKYASEEFQNIDPSFSHWRVDPYDPVRIWVDVKPFAPGYEGAPQSMSFAFDDEGFCTRITSGAVMDPSIGNGGGLGGQEGYKYSLGQGSWALSTRPLPRALGRLRKRILQPFTKRGVDDYSLLGENVDVISKPAATTAQKLPMEKFFPEEKGSRASIDPGMVDINPPAKDVKTEGDLGNNDKQFFYTTAYTREQNDVIERDEVEQQQDDTGRVLKREKAKPASSDVAQLAAQKADELIRQISQVGEVKALKQLVTQEADEGEKRKQRENKDTAVRNKRMTTGTEAERSTQRTQIKQVRMIDGSGKQIEHRRAESQRKDDIAKANNLAKKEDRKNQVILQSAEAEKRQQLLAKQKAETERKRQKALAKQAEEAEARRKRIETQKAEAEQKRLETQALKVAEKAEFERRRLEIQIQKAAEEEARKRNLAAQKVEEEKRKNEIARQRVEATERRKLLAAQKSAEEEKRKKDLATQQAEEVKRKQAIAKQQAEAVEKQRLIAAQKAETARREKEKKMLLEKKRFDESKKIAQQEAQAKARRDLEEKQKRSSQQVSGANRSKTDKQKREQAALETLSQAASRATITLFSTSLNAANSLDSKAKDSGRRSPVKKAPIGVPTIRSWKRNKEGSITGFISGSRNFSEGEQVTTSPIKKGKIAAGEIVTTGSGSRYFLG